MLLECLTTDIVQGDGAVYIYNGGNRYFDPNPSQKIYGSDLKEPTLQTFGTSISSGETLDTQEIFPDIDIKVRDSEIENGLKRGTKSEKN